jgi:TRAP-type C4-dicarboxylate transport system permease small subunit
MKKFMDIVLKADFFFFTIAGTALCIMMLVTLTDVLMRSMGRPIVGSVEIISFLGTIVVGFSIPYTSWTKGHIFVDLVTEKLSPSPKKILQVVTRLIGIILFILVAYNFVLYGLDLMRSNQVSGAFKLPLYPLAFGLSASCCFQVATMVCDLVNTIMEKPHE